MLPFTPIVYAPICRACVKKDDYDTFKIFVQAGLVIPVLTNSYSYYDENLRAFLTAHDHVSVQEFHAYRYLRAVSEGSQPMCSHCMGERVKKAVGRLENEPNTKRLKTDFEYLIRSLEPYPKSDEELIDLAFKSFEGRKSEKIEQLQKMAWTIGQIRLDEAFNSPVLLDEKELSALPSNISATVDEARSKAASLRKIVADGLSIEIPTDIPTEKYIELVKDYQPRITKTIDGVLAKGATEASILDVSKSVMEINRELERIRGLRRYAVLEASMGFFRNNKLLIAATILAGSMGLAGSLAGCVASGGVAVGAKWAKKYGLLKESEAVRRLRQIVARDLQPAADLFLKAYLGAKAPAVNVLSLQKRMIDAKADKITKKAS